MNWKIIVSLTSLLDVGLALINQDIGCFAPGECVNSEILAVTSAYFNGCLEDCQDEENHPGCEAFTHYANSSTCFLYKNCAELDSSGCTDCISSEKDCAMQCYHEDVSCIGTDVGNFNDVYTPEECMDLCYATPGCKWMTHYDTIRVCVLTEDCREVDPECPYRCTVAWIDNDSCNLDHEAEENLVLVAMGGNTGSNVLTAADTVNPQGGCNVELPPLPFPSNYGLGMAYSDGAPMVCGGSGAGDGRRCLVHSLSQDSWIEGPQMLHPRSNFSRVVKMSDGRYFVAGGGESPTSAEFFQDGEFVEAPDLPYEFQDACLVEVEPGTLFISGGRRDDLGSTAYLFFPEDGSWDRLPDMPYHKERHACGVVLAGATEGSGLQGIDIVAAGGFYSEATYIYNMDTGVWRPGPILPYTIDGAGYVPYGTSFLVVGGYEGPAYLDTIYQYGIAGEDWLLLDARLGAEREQFGLAWVGEEFVGCG